MDAADRAGRRGCRPRAWCIRCGVRVWSAGRSIHGIIALDIANPDIPVEVSRISFPGNYLAHWTGWDAATSRLVVTPNVDGIHRLYLVSLDQANGKLTLDESFRDQDGRPGFNFDNRKWPQGWTGSATPHGAVFSR